ncbi:MAG: helix-turn-helix domain-containing protein [Acholeplasmataceae bacterium]
MKQDTIGQKIRELRTSNSIKQRVLANKLNVTISTVSNWETGRRTPSIDDLRKIARIFDVKLGYFDIDTDRSKATPKAEQDSNLTQSIEFKTYDLYWNHAEFTAIILSALLFILGFAVFSRFALYFYGAGTFLSVGLIVNLINKLIGVKRQNTRKVILPLEYQVVYIHRYEEKRAYRIKRTLSVISSVSIFTNGFVFLWVASIFGQLSNELIDITVSLYAFVVIITAYYRFRIIDSKDTLKKRLDYYSVSSNFQATSLISSLFLNAVALLIISYSFYFLEVAFDFSFMFYLIMILSTLNVVASYIIFVGYHHFIARYSLYSIDPENRIKRIN